MRRNSRIQLIFILAVILACVYGIIGLPTSKQQLVENWKKNIHLGLDLRGGSFLVVQVNEWDAFNGEAGQVADRLKDLLRKNNVGYSDIDVAEAHSLQDAQHVAVVIKGVSPNDATALRNQVSDNFPQWLLSSAGSDYRLTMRPTDALAMWQSVLQQTKNTMDKKINALGLSEASVQQRREDADAQLLIQMPDVDDPSHVKSIIQTAAKLELYDVKSGPFSSREEALAQTGGILPPGTKVIGSAPGSSNSGIEGGYYVVSRIPVVRGQDIRDSRPQMDQQNGTWETTFVLSQGAADRFGDYTASHIGQKLAIVLDGKVLEAPSIKNQIRDNGVIEGARDQQAASDLALNLKAGTLPASITYLQESTVGPSLGADSIRSGFMAGIAGVIAVVVAMLIYYRKAGINATLALVLNAVILIACLSYFGAVLTLPGIAGIILTIGMAVDSNVLIFERIREELRAGKAIPAAVDAGFQKAFLTIVDTHITTVVSCAILFLFGSAPIKGFAVTLVIGLIANVFTAVFVSKFIFNWELSGPTPVRELSI